MPTEALPTWEETNEALPSWEETAEPQSMPPIRLSPYERARLAGPTEPMGAFGPAHPEEVAALPDVLQIPATIAEPIFTAAEDMASDWLRRTGIDPSAQPGQPFVTIPRVPIFGAMDVPESARGPIAATERFLGGIEKGLGKIATGVLTPGQALLAPAAPLKPVQAMFAGTMLGALPESLAEIPKAQTIPELGERIGVAGAEAAMVGGIGAHMAGVKILPRSALEAAKEREVSNALKERQFKEGRVPEHPGTEGERLPAEAGGGNRPEPAAGLEEKAPLPLTPVESAYIEAERQAIDTPVQVIDTTIPTEENAPFARRLAGNIATIDRDSGTILINGKEFSGWLRSIPEDRRAEAVRSLLAEENIHLNVTDDMALDYWKTLTGLEKAINRRRYVGTWGGERLVSGEPVQITDTNFGHEALRFRMQQLSRMTPREIAESVGRERWTLQSITALESVVRGLREALGTQASGTAKALLDRVQFNLTGAKAVMAGNPAALRKWQGAQEDPDALIGEVNLMSPEDFTAFATTLPQGMTMASFELGRSLTRPDQLLAMQAARTESGRLFREAMKNKDLEGALAYSNKTQFYREAIEAATGSGGSGDMLKTMDPTYQPPFPEAAEEFPAALRKRTGGEQPELVLPAVKAGEQVARSASPVTQMRMQFGAAPAAAERPTGFRTMTGFEAERQAYRYITQAVDDFIARPSGQRISKGEMAETAAGEKPKATKPTKGAPPPSWKDFVAYMQSQFGAMQAGALGEIWDRTVYRRLENATGEILSELRKAMNLRNQLGDRAVADPPARKPAFALEAEATGEARGLMREAAKAEAAAQKYRNTVIRAIAAKMIGERLKESKPLTREITVEDVGYNREHTQPVFNELASDIRDNPARVGPFLTADAREFDHPVSHTKRLTVLRNRTGNTIELVSTYLDGRRGPVLVDPDSPAKGHAKLADVMKRYQPIASVLLDEPVKGFRKRFKDIRSFEDLFATEVRERTSQKPFGEIGTEGEFVKGPTTGRYAAPGVFQAEPGAVERISKESLGIQPDEAMSILDQATAEAGRVESSQDIRDALSGLKDLADSGNLTWLDWQAISGYQKIYDAIREKWPILDPEQAFDQMIDEVYEHARTSESSADFAAKTQAAYRREPPANVRPDAQRQAQAAPSETARELTMRERPAPIESAEVPIDQGTRAEAETFLSPDAAAYMASQEYIQAQTKGEIPPRFSETIYRQLGEREVPKTPYRMGREKKAFEGEEEAPPAGTETAPAALRKYVDGTKTIIDQTLLDALRAYSEWMVDRLRRTGGPASQALAADLNHIIDRERTLYGSLTPYLDPARKAAGQLTRATAWMSGVRQVTPTAGVANAIDAVENRRAPPPYAVPLVSLVRTANLEIGRLIATVIPRFIPTGRFQRNLTALGYDVVRMGEGPMFDSFVEGVAAINHFTPNTVRAFFRDWKAILDDPGVDAEAIERVNQDYQRKFPQTISHVKYMGQWQEVMHANVFNYLETAARRASHITAFRETFPSTPAGRTAFAQLMRTVRDELPGEHQPNLRNLMRALQGHPTDNYSNWGMLAATKPTAQLVRFVNQTVGNLFARLVLTGQMAVQPGENIAGSTPVFLGYRNYLEGIARLGPLPFQSPMYRQLELTGRVNRAIHDYSFDQTSPLRSAFRITGNVISRVFAEQFLNELQEAWSASTAQVVAERVTSGNLSAWERRMLPQTFRAMGFTPAEVGRLMAGNAELLSQFQGKAASFLTSGNKAIAEGSALGSNRLVNSIFRFQAYPMMKTNQLRKVTGQMFEAWSSGTAQEKRAATEQFGRFLFGNLVQGALTTGIAAMAYEGLFGAKIRAQEAKDDLLGFLGESFLSSVSGPMYLLWRGARAHSGLKGYGEQATRLLFPYSITQDLTEFAAGTGHYHDLDLFDRAGKFVQQKLPGTRALAQGIAMVGLSQDNPQLDQSIRAFYRWRRDALGYSTYETFFQEDDRKRFRMNMKKAVEALKDHDRKAFAKAYAAALAEKGQKTVAASMRSRKILKTPDGKDLSAKQRLMLRKRIGDEAYKKILMFDALLDAVSASE